mmetsp:Transcript_29544/g.86073  ORF Transcript_29544/g.86073 Transcript_29544/m.86073 type:complete len:207 (+) Transcript_29544:100-720(+)
MGHHALLDLGVRVGRTNPLGEYVHRTKSGSRWCDGGQCRHWLVVLLLMLVGDDHSGRTFLGCAGGPLGRRGGNGQRLTSLDDPEMGGHPGGLFRVEVMHQDELPLAGLGLLLGGLDEAVNATVQRVDVGRVDVGTADAILTVVTELDVILSDFGWVGTLPDPIVAVDLVVAHGHSIVEKDSTGSGRAGRRGHLLLEDGLSGGHAPT